MSQYTLQLQNIFLGHGWSRPTTVRDGVDDNLETAALVASGDYFITLATRLDKLSQDLAKTSPAAHLELEKIIKQLTYLQRHYTINKSDSRRDYLY
jgi:hypothetical protein